MGVGWGWWKEQHTNLVADHSQGLLYVLAHGTTFGPLERFLKFMKLFPPVYPLLTIFDNLLSQASLYGP